LAVRKRNPNMSTTIVSRARGALPSFRPIAFVIGLLLIGLAGAMLICALVDAGRANPDWRVFMISAAITGFIGGASVLSARSRDRFQLELRQAFLLTASSWLAMSVFAALPFLFLGQGLDLADAVFEAVSGLTTTGSTIIIGLDGLPPGILLWRSLLQWIGGIGIIGMAIVILPFLRVGGMQLFHTESSDRSDKIVGRPGLLAAYIGMAYVLLTLACMAAYWYFGMTFFDSVNHAMTTVSTGGYSTHDASFAYFRSDGLHWTGVVFMAAGAMPFAMYVRLAQGARPDGLVGSQARLLVTLLIAVSLGLALWHAESGTASFGEALLTTAFNVTSIVTTTGYASADYTLWGPLAAAAFLVLTVVGGCTGSTSGGIKIFRFQVLWLLSVNQINRLIRPHEVTRLNLSGRPVTDEVGASVLAFLCLFLAAIVAGTVFLSAFGLDLVTSLSAVVTAMANVGPGIGPIVGPAGNFSSLPDGAKWVLSGAMLLGRLELFTILVLFTPRFWRW
jgi:trk system potassium uptake protein TrkH